MIFIIASIAIFSVNADDETDPLDANLVIHYDFEGADILEAMKDKAPAGTVNDDLAPVAGTVNFSNLTVDNVKGTITNTAASAGVRTDRSADTEVVTGASSWFVRTKLNHQDTNQYFFIVEMRTFGSSSIRPFAIQYDTKTNELCACISKGDTPGTAQNLRWAYEYDYASNEYINIVVVVNQAVVDDATVYQASMYVSKNLPETAADWTLLGTKTIGATIAEPTAYPCNMCRWKR